MRKEFIKILRRGQHRGSKEKAGVHLLHELVQVPTVDCYNLRVSDVIPTATAKKTAAEYTQTESRTETFQYTKKTQKKTVMQKSKGQKQLYSI